MPKAAITIEDARKGGQNGTGASKRRPKAHYARLTKLRQQKAQERKVLRAKSISN